MIARIGLSFMDFQMSRSSHLQGRLLKLRQYFAKFNKIHPAQCKGNIYLVYVTKLCPSGCPKAALPKAL